MAGFFNSPAIGLRARLAQITPVLSWFSKHGRGVTLLPDPVIFTGDGTTTKFTLPRGQSPVLVTVAGAVKAKGSAYDWTVSDNGQAKSIVFTVKPAAAAIIQVHVSGA